MSIIQAGNMSTITVNMDIEAMPCVLGNFTQGISPFQGYRQGEMVLWTSGRRSGKSTFYYSHTKNLCKEIVLPMNPPKSKYQFSRAKWYTVQLNGNATWRLSDEYNQIIDWCTEHFGEHPKKTDAWTRWYVGLGYINFRDAKDYEWFVLRWS